MADSIEKKGRLSACAKNHEIVARMAAEGATLTAIGEAVGTTKRHVRRYLDRHEISRPAWRERPPGAHPMARPTGGHLNPSWKGGRTRDKRGYWLVWMPSHPQANRHGYVREHRLLMEKKLGRYLTRKEVVDHVNGDPSDNRIENLRLFASNGEHLRATLTGVPCPARGRKLDASRTASKTSGRSSRGKNRRYPA